MSIEVASLSAIRRLVTNYALALDARDVDRFGALFVDNAEVTIRDIGDSATVSDRQRRGRDEIVTAIARMRERYLRTFHFLGQQTVEADGSGQAKGTVYCIAHHIHFSGTDMMNRVVYLVYDDVYEQAFDDWRFRARTLNYLWEEARPVTQISRLEGDPADLP